MGDKAWTDKAEYKRLSALLAESSERDFERRALPLLRAIWPRAVGTPARREYDRRGIDHLVWTDTAPFELVVQCKGFTADERDLGASQVRQCLASIESFRTSGEAASVYLLVHNRDARSSEFREPIEAALADLVAAGSAQRAELWSRQRLLREAFSAMALRVRRALTTESVSIVDIVSAAEPPLCTGLGAVPLRTADLVASQYALTRTDARAVGLAEPAAEILRATAPSVTVLLGEAGFGKTTAAIAACALSPRRVVYVPAARFTHVQKGTKDLLESCVDMDKLLDDCDALDRSSWEELARAALEYTLRDGELPVILLIDGLDESVFLARRGGIQHLVNALRGVLVPVILVARTEFWSARQADFALSFGPRGTDASTIHNRRLRLVELLPWGDAEIVELATRYAAAQTEASARHRVQEFIGLVRGGQFAALYGDIPRRPLFLRFILETVAASGIVRTSRARLLAEWAQMKILRDVGRPAMFGGTRAGIASEAESADTTVELALLAMRGAALLMTARDEDGNVELLPHCPLEGLLRSDARLAGIVEPTGLALNSLLLMEPVSARSSVRTVRFAHRVYQEYFLACAIRAQPDALGRCVLPEGVRTWIEELAHDATTDA